MFHSDFLRDPYPTYRRLRNEAPVSRLEPGGPWLVARYADVLRALKDPVLFRSGRQSALRLEPSHPEFLLKTRGLVGADGSEHARIRGVIRKAFVPTRMRILEQGIRELVRARVQRFTNSEAFDFVGGLARPLPMEVISLLMGIDLNHLGELQRWCDLLVSWGSSDCQFSAEEGMNEAKVMYEFFAREIAMRSGRADDDLISILALELNHEEKIFAPMELISFLRLLLVAGSETTTHLISNTLLALLSQDELWSSARRDRGGISNLIEESLRYDSPVPSLVRWAAQSTEICGVKIRENEAVLFLLASANRDESVFAEPERFLLGRNERSHLSFGAGAHACLGVQLARLQSQIVFEELFETCAKIDWAGDSELKRVESFFVRGPVQLIVKAQTAR